MAGGGRPPVMPAEPASPQARPRPYPTPPAGAVKSHPCGGGSHLHPAGRSTMPACRVGLLVAALLLGVLLLGFPPVTSTGVEKTGVCPELKDDVNCTQECGSDGECADNLKCCRAGCATVCHLPNEKQGSCPQVDLPLTPLGLCRDQCQVDSQCSGQMKCCRNGCGKVSCVTPVF